MHCFLLLLLAIAEGKRFWKRSRSNRYEEMQDEENTGCLNCFKKQNTKDAEMYSPRIQDEEKLHAFNQLSQMLVKKHESRVRFGGIKNKGYVEIEVFQNFLDASIQEKLAKFHEISGFILVEVWKHMYYYKPKYMTETQVEILMDT